MPRKLKVIQHHTKVMQSDERNARNMLRVELSAMLKLASAGQGHFAQDILERASPQQRDWIKREMRQLAKMLDHKVACEDDA